MQQRHVGPPVAQQPLLLADAAQQHVDRDRAGLGGVRVEQLGQQLAGRTGLRDEDQAGAAGRGERGAAGAALGGLDRVEGRPALIRVTNAMLPLLRRSASPRIVNMSSTVGSLTRQSAPGAETGPISAAYAPSKTFLNAVTVQYAKELSDTNILINAGCPGFCATDLNGFRGVRTPEQGAAIAIKLATLPDDGPTGGFFDDAGPIPW
ncbi:SDR family NAD(P)-dependent oxidoreductase [Microbispora hainanensis]|uniref:SDR family NAD(P)-dependent oxidoreductase n=1 Tax=Microbispora hainanensis TaxID=568844 RepID=A0ABZ1T1Y2_9ACTN|nr:SDR family NAD(P)-dependent oxidoreductase [Microbispora hainanensis]